MVEIVQDGYGNDAGTMLTLSEYATKIDKSTRQIKRWLSGTTAFELPGAVKDPATDEWRIPADARPRPRSTPVAQTQPQDHSQAPLTLVQPGAGPGTQMLPWQAAEPPEPTLIEDLDDEPGYLTLSDAARYLGIPQAQIRANAERFGLEPVGVNGSLRVPQRVIRRIMGV
jgi:hypothetical protein